MLRDIFAAMFPDFGDVQLERIRSAIRESYNRLGWGKESESPREIPEFRAFYELLQQDANVLSKNITTSDQSRRVADRLKQLEKYHALFFREGTRQPNTVALSPP